MKYNVKASFYIVTDCNDKNTPTWTHILEFSFQNTKKSELKLNYDFLPEKLKKCQFDNPKSKLEFAKKLKPFLKNLSHENRNIVLEKIKQIFNDIEIPEIMMSWSDLRTLQNSGHSIGSHTVSHCMLGTITDEKEVEAELKKSAETIYNHLGVYPKTISYPVGSYNDTTIKISKLTGYKIGLAVKQCIYYPKKDNIYEIPRIELYNEPWWKTKLII